MLQMFGFDRVGVVIGDIYFIDPNPAQGQEGPERGVRLELRMLRPGDLGGSFYSSRPITIAASRTISSCRSVIPACTFAVR